MNLVELFLTLQNQMRVFHWQTTSFAEHKAFGKTYEALDDLIDNFIEIHMGKNERPMAKDKFNISLFNISEDKTSVIDAYIDVLMEDLPQALNEKDTDLLNIRDEMVGELNKLKYLLSLKS
jgi:DNA-binding ferritin-like protein